MKKPRRGVQNRKVLCQDTVRHCPTRAMSDENIHHYNADLTPGEKKRMCTNMHEHTPTESLGDKFSTLDAPRPIWNGSFPLGPRSRFKTSFRFVVWPPSLPFASQPMGRAALSISRASKCPLRGCKKKKKEKELKAPAGALKVELTRGLSQVLNDAGTRQTWCIEFALILDRQSWKKLI